MLIYGAATFSDAAGHHAEVDAAMAAMRAFHVKHGLESRAALTEPGIKLNVALPPLQAGALEAARFVAREGSSTFGFFGACFAPTSSDRASGMDPSELLNLLRRVQMRGIPELYALDGEFCAIVISNEDRRLTFVKDHFGTRPLHYWLNRQSGMIAFASSVAALCAIDGVSLAPNKRALASYLVTYFPPSEDTFLGDIAAVPPASSVTLCADGALRTTRHWRPQPNHAWWAEHRHRPVEAFREELVRAIVTRLSAHGKTALSLSSGIDSGSIACVATAHKPDHRLLTFTEVLPQDYQGAAWDERAAVERLVSSRANVESVYSDGCDYDPLGMGAPAFDLWRRPNPSFQSYFYQGISAAAASLGADVILGGVGGDQCVSADATGYAPELLLRGQIKDAWAQVARLGRARGVPFLQATKSFLVTPLVPPRLLRWKQAALRRDWLSDLALRPAFAAEFNLEAYFEKTGWTFPVKRYTGFNARAIDTLETLIQTGGLSGESNFAEWQGVEYRYPLYDWRLIEAFLAIPSSYKASATQDRLMLREAARPYVPSFIIDNARKGPGSPYLLTRLRQERRNLAAGFDRFSRLDLWREIVDVDKVRAGMAWLASSSDWQTNFSFVDHVLQPYFLGDYIERMSRLSTGQAT